MKKIPTAREFYDNHYSDDCVVMMIEFAKLHVEAVLEKASEEAKIIKSVNFGWEKIDKDSILKSYPLENIK
jgi:hypothetical protein